MQAALTQLNCHHLIAISMDGPNVNWKFHRDFSSELAEQTGSKLLNVGSFGLHVIHNSVKTGFQIWKLDSVLRALHSHFHHVPARREDFQGLTDCDIFPKNFCGHRWMENEPMAATAIEMWPALENYVKSKSGEGNEGSHSFTVLLQSTRDSMILPKLHFFLSVVRMFSSFLHKYQSDRPLIMYLEEDLRTLIRVSFEFFWPWGSDNCCHSSKYFVKYDSLWDPVISLYRMLYRGS